MYRRVLLAFDGTLEGRTALREGALLALRCGADVFLIAVVADTPGLRAAEGAYAGAVASVLDRYRPVLDEGVARLTNLGFSPRAKLVLGEPTLEIAAFAREVGADLVVVSHRRRSLLERWWAGNTGAHLTDHIGCSLLVARNAIPEAQFEAELNRARRDT